MVPKKSFFLSIKFLFFMTGSSHEVHEKNRIIKKFLFFISRLASPVHTQFSFIFILFLFIFILFYFVFLWGTESSKGYGGRSHQRSMEDGVLKGLWRTESSKG